MPILPQVKPENINRGESKFYDLASRSNLFESDNSVYLFHSLKISEPGYNKLLGEADFVYLDKQYLIVFEIKGGDVKYNSATSEWWILGGTEKGDPFSQAAKNIFSIRRTLSEFTKLNFNSGQGLIFGYGVIFPDTLKPKEFKKKENGTIEYDPQLIGDYSDISDDKSLARYIERLKEYWSSHSKYKHNYDTGQIGIDERTLINIKNFFRRDIRFDVPNSEILKLTDRKIESYTEQQKSVLVSVNFNRGKGSIILGGPGTGKTILASELAISKSAEGTVLFVCYNNNLADFIRYKFSDTTNIHVFSVHKLYAQYLNKFNVQLNKSSYSDSEFYNELFPMTFYDILETYKAQIALYDFIVIDEGQDIFNEFHLLGLTSILKGGIESGDWAIFMDYNYQKIYNAFDEEFFNYFRYKYSSVTFALTLNCRNHTDIAKKASCYTKLERQDCLRKEGSPSVITYFYEQKDMHKKLRKKLNELISSGVPPSSIAVLCWNKNSKEMIISSEEEKFTEYNPASDKICVTTIHGYKGLEAHYVIVPDLQEDTYNYKKPEQANLLYIAFSRAKTQFILQAHASYETIFDDLKFEQSLS
jgi:hypothetical protein